MVCQYHSHLRARVSVVRPAAGQAQTDVDDDTIPPTQPSPPDYEDAEGAGGSGGEQPALAEQGCVAEKPSASSDDCSSSTQCTAVVLAGPVIDVGDDDEDESRRPTLTDALLRELRVSKTAVRVRSQFQPSLPTIQESQSSIATTAPYNPTDAFERSPAHSPSAATRDATSPGTPYQASDALVEPSTLGDAEAI
jgi:hypothetical protein